MGIRALRNGCWLIILFINLTGSDWLNCAHIPECNCKWSSGKKTASCVSAGLKQLPHLATEIQVLDLHGNQLKSLGQDAFASIELLHLQRLNLSSSNLRSLHPDAFRELRILVELDLSQNELFQLSPDTFRGNDRLRLLVLNDNPLTILVAEQFPPLQHLKKLELVRCKLQAIHPFAFVHLRALETIHVHQNSISYLHRNTFNLPVLKTLTLSDNPWYCDCRLRDFHEWFLNSNLGNEEVYCEGPENKAQISWRSLKGNDMVCPPWAYTTPTVIRTEVGADISFGCFVRGDPKPSVTWSYHHIEIHNSTSKHSDILVYRYQLNNFDEFRDDYINKSAQWVNVTISNVTSELSGEWKCSAKSQVGESSAYLTLFLPKARTATARVPPDYSTFIYVAGAMLAMTGVGFIAACVCWKTQRRRVPPSRSFTDQEKKLLDTSIAASCDRTSADLGSSSYGFEMLDRSMSMESEDTQRCMEPVQITIEGPPGSFPPPPAEFALPAPYGNIFISVQVSGHNDEYPDLLGGGATLPRRSRTCFLKSAYDNMGPRITAAGSSTWSLPGANVDNKKDEKDTQLTMPLSTFSTEFTAL
ncbi:leucine-rich repeat-containing protein 24-like [Plodia interpunctella]|uniref:leucine-rich repeat-containing protein 24-like n=1 Tax=Plodia interpunctella TaxID=58824 RepID=UPI002367C718|nr:leucine-rich repeat-containing protein 24-like [Plodia interpunctella]XP_053616579.1 leucine-rich repeat-containing protein 24-like [Plodia interpunctella]